MADIESAHLLTTSAYAGFQLTVRVVIYPQLADVAPDDFVRYLAAYQRRVTYLVAPLFAALAVTTALVLLGTGHVALRAVAVGSFAVILGTTAGVAVPLHRRLATSWDAVTHRRLLRADSCRLLAATAHVVVAVLLIQLA